MEKTKAFYLVVMIVFIFVGGIQAAKSVHAAEAPDGFVGIKWGSSKAEVAQLAKARGYREKGKFALKGGEILPYDGPESPTYQGEFLGIPCFYQFTFINNSFYKGTVNILSDWYALKSDYANIKKQLTDKYGQVSEKSDGNGRDLEWQITGVDRQEIIIRVMLQKSDEPESSNRAGRIFVIYENLNLKKTLNDKSL